MDISVILSLILSSELDQINMGPIGNYTEPNEKKIIKIGSQLVKKSGNIDKKKKKKNQSNWEPPRFLKSVKKLNKKLKFYSLE